MDTDTDNSATVNRPLSRLSAGKKVLVVEGDIPLGDDSIDILIDGRRVWSVRPGEPDERGRVLFEWPRALWPYLHGQSELTVRTSATHEIVAQGNVRIGRTPGPIRVRDAHGRWLAVNKWDRLGPSFEGNESGVKERLLTSAARLIGDLQDLDYPVFIVGGTLLGAMRAGTMLPHDDDIDLAWICRETNSLDISLASMKMERELQGRGYTCIRLSMAHLQVTFFDEVRATDHYVDIFTGFFMNGEYGQPFALRGVLEPTDLEPIGAVTLNGRAFPAPAKPEAWLELAYGKSWLVPDPSFAFEVPPATMRRFENWFGVFNRGRAFWEKHFEKFDARANSTENNDEVDRFLGRLPPAANVVDLGCSDGRLTERMAAAGHRVIGLDFSYEALRLARSASPGGVDYRYLNFNDRHALLGFGLELVESGEQWYFCANHLFAGVPDEGRANVFLFLRQLLRHDSFAYASVDTNFIRAYRRERPDSWHLPLEWLEQEASPFGLSVEVVNKGQRMSPFGRRAVASVVIRRSAPDQSGIKEIAS